MFEFEVMFPCREPNLQRAEVRSDNELFSFNSCLSLRLCFPMEDITYNVHNRNMYSRVVSSDYDCCHKENLSFLTSSFLSFKTTALVLFYINIKCK